MDVKDETIVVDTTKQKVDTDVKNDNVKTYTEDVFKEVVAQRDEAKKKLRAIEEEKQTLLKKQEDDSLKAKGQYDTLIANIENERKAEKDTLNNMVKQTYLTALGSEYGIAKTDYLKLFTEKIEIDGMEIKNDKDIRSSFEKFKTDNASLFTSEKKVVPKTDNKPFHKPDTNPEMTGHNLMVLGLQERLAGK